MTSSYRVVASLVLSVLLLPRAAFSATPIADFEARLAQTHWNLQVVEGLVRSVEVDSETQPTPDALSAYLALLSENVASLTSLAVVKMTTEQKSVVAASLKSTAGRLKDLALLAGSRGLAGAVSSLQQLESTCLATKRLL
ncbi:MAG: hypothetical protein ABI610_12840 [Acidobacteriota bacterium]